MENETTISWPFGRCLSPNRLFLKLVEKMLKMLISYLFSTGENVWTIPETWCTTDHVRSQGRGGQLRGGRKESTLKGMFKFITFKSTGHEAFSEFFSDIQVYAPQMSGCFLWTHKYFRNEPRDLILC